MRRVSGEIGHRQPRRRILRRRFHRLVQRGRGLRVVVVVGRDIGQFDQSEDIVGVLGNDLFQIGVEMAVRLSILDNLQH